MRFYSVGRILVSHMQKKAVKDKRHCYITVRAREDELQSWEAAAKELGVSISEFARSWLTWGSERHKSGELIRK